MRWVGLLGISIKKLIQIDMRIISRRTLREFWAKHADAEPSLKAWYTNVKRADWKTPSDIKAAYRNASFVENNRVVFNKSKRQCADFTSNRLVLFEVGKVK